MNDAAKFEVKQRVRVKRVKHDAIPVDWQGRIGTIAELFGHDPIGGHMYTVVFDDPFVGYFLCEGELEAAYVTVGKRAKVLDYGAETRWIDDRDQYIGKTGIVTEFCEEWTVRFDDGARHSYSEDELEPVE